ncbi:mitofusin-2-like [Dreissena polymorpha]|uniref:mitofusin-2-like n=1 Tax=Dreissena polymorpha TaxID=45954 RepID=UPI00226535C4|nr:mitofusin-2-like [Dreissena polymorpha]
MAHRILDLFNVTRTSFMQVCEEILDFLRQSETITKGVDDIFRYAAGKIEVPEIPVCHVELSQIKLDAVMTMLKRSHVKITVLGRNSCGKSTVINALLGSDVLPMGMGHVTNWFVHMQGTDLLEGFVETENEPGVQKPINSLQELASALQDEHVATNSTVKVSWPKEMCPLLSHDLVIIDRFVGLYEIPYVQEIYTWRLF